jgi:hypothetical protein
MQDAQGNYYAFRRTIPLSLVNFREATAGDVGNIVANGGLLASDTTPVLSGTASTVSQQILWAASNVDQILVDISLPEDFDGRDDVLVDLLVASGGTTNPATFTVATNWDGAAADISDTATDPAASTTYHWITATIDRADVPDSPGTVTLALTPAAHGTDTVAIRAVRIRHVPRVQALV